MGVIFCDALRDLVPFAQFKKREKHPCRIPTFSKVAVATRELYIMRKWTRKLKNMALLHFVCHKICNRKTKIRQIKFEIRLTV